MLALSAIVSSKIYFFPSPSKGWLGQLTAATKLTCS